MSAAQIREYISPTGLLRAWRAESAQHSRVDLAGSKRSPARVHQKRTPDRPIRAGCGLIGINPGANSARAVGRKERPASGGAAGRGKRAAWPREFHHS